MMRRTQVPPDEKRLTLRLSQTLWRQLQQEAARRQVPATRLIQQLLEEQLSGVTSPPPSASDPHSEAPVELARQVNTPSAISVAVAQIQALRTREEGWNGYDALPVDPHGITSAEAWLRALHQEALTAGAAWIEPHVTSSAEGEVVLQWWNDPKRLTVYFSAAEATFIKSWGPDIETEMEDGDTASAASRDRLWEWLTG
jgi:predicted DNA-binding ribbon-helix-helix protein